MYPTVLFVAIAFTITMFQQSVAIFEISSELVCFWRARVISRVSGKGTYDLRIDPGICRVGKSLLPFGLTIGQMKVIQRGFQIKYLSLLIDNLTNAVLLFQV